MTEEFRRRPNDDLVEPMFAALADEGTGPHRGAGAALIGLGVGLALVGLLAWLVWG